MALVYVEEKKKKKEKAVFIWIICNDHKRCHKRVRIKYGGKHFGNLKNKQKTTTFFFFFFPCKLLSVFFHLPTSVKHLNTVIKIVIFRLPFPFEFR